MASPPSMSVTKPPASRTRISAGRDVPGRDIALPVAVEPAGRDEGEVERRRAEPPQPRDLVLDGAEFAQAQLQIAAAEMRQAAGDHGIGQALARRHAQPLVVEERALAALGDVKLVGDRIVDHAGDDRARALQPDRDGELRDAVQEIGGAVERIDDPGVGRVGAGVAAAFLAEEAVAGTRLGQFGFERFFGLRSAAVTKLPGPLSDTWRFSTSPKSRLSVRAALRAAAIITLRRAECCITPPASRRRLRRSRPRSSRRWK